MGKKSRQKYSQTVAEQVISAASDDPSKISEDKNTAANLVLAKLYSKRIADALKPLEAFDVESCQIPLTGGSTLEIPVGLTVVYGHPGSGKSYFVNAYLDSRPEFCEYLSIEEPVESTVPGPLSWEENTAMLAEIWRSYDEFAAQHPDSETDRFVLIDSITYSLAGFPRSGNNNTQKYSVSSHFSRILASMDIWARSHHLALFASVNPDDVLPDAQGYDWLLNKIKGRVAAVVHMTGDSESGYTARITRRNQKYDARLKRVIDFNREWVDLYANQKPEASDDSSSYLLAY